MDLGHAIDWVVTLVPLTGAYAVLTTLSIAHYVLRLARRPEIGRGKKLAKVAAVIFLWTLVATLPMAADLSRVLQGEVDLVSSASPDGSHRLVVTSTSPLSFGAHGISIYLGREGGIERQIASTRLANDGKTLTPGSNYRVTWTGDERVQVWLAGEEQEAETITIEIQGDRALIRAGSGVKAVALSGVQAWLQAGTQHLPAIILGLIPFVLLLAWNLWLWRYRVA